MHTANREKNLDFTAICGCTLLQKHLIIKIKNDFYLQALLGYGKELKDVEWRCGGTLISNQFVLSAALCR